MRQRLERFLAGRYGVDQLSKVLLIISLVLLVISMFTHWGILYVLALVSLIYTYFRMFSRNIAKRSAENQAYMNFRYGLSVKRDKAKRRHEQSKIYRFYKCPNCKQEVRVPRGKGKICITCPKCRTEFVRKS